MYMVKASSPAVRRKGAASGAQKAAR